MKQSRKPLKHNATTELDTIFMVEFDCPAAAGTGKWRDNKTAHRNNYRAALRYVRPPANLIDGSADVSNLGTFYGTFLEQIYKSYGVYAPAPMPYGYGYVPAPTPSASVTAAAQNGEPSLDVIHSPLCDALASKGDLLAYGAMCYTFFGFSA